MAAVGIDPLLPAKKQRHASHTSQPPPQASQQHLALAFHELPMSCPGVAWPVHPPSSTATATDAIINKMTTLLAMATLEEDAPAAHAQGAKELFALLVDMSEKLAESDSQLRQYRQEADAQAQVIWLCDSYRVIDARRVVAVGRAESTLSPHAASRLATSPCSCAPPR